MQETLRKLFNKQNNKYYFTEMAASIVAYFTSSGAAVLSDKYFDSDFIISTISAIGGTSGFAVGFIIIYGVLNVRQYYRRNKTFTYDVKNILVAVMQGLVAMYIVRIPFQMILQKFGVAPAIAAPISQFVGGMVAMTVRAYHNHKAKIFAHSEQEDVEKGSENGDQE